MLIMSLWVFFLVWIMKERSGLQQDHENVCLHTHTHTHTCIHVWFTIFVGTLDRRNAFYTVQTVYAIAKTNPTPKSTHYTKVH